MISFDHLSPVQFEEFCFDLLRSLDFQALNWRKGTGLKSSPADQGRDIEAVLLRKEIDNQICRERWFIECKHYKKGLPPEELQGAITWASSERPDVLLIIVSNFLSNPAKTHITNFNHNNRPLFRIKVWENKDLETLSAESHSLRVKYRMSTEVPFFSILNKYHIIYTTKPQLNTMEYFFNLMDALDENIRDRSFASTYSETVKPRFRPVLSEYCKIGDLVIDKVDYKSFRARCLQVADAEGHGFIHRIVSSALSWMFHYGDKTMLNDFVQRHRWMLEHSLKAASETDDPKKKEINLNIAAMSKRKIDNLPSQIEESYKDYTYICENLVRKLLIE